MNIETDQVTMNVSAPDLPNTAARKNSGDDASLMDRMQGSTSLLSNTGNDSPNNNSVNDDGDISDKLAPKKRPFQGDGDDDSAVKKLHSPSLADVADGKIDVTKKSQAAKKKWKKPKDKPNRPLSAYNLFFQSQRVELLGGDPELAFIDKTKKRVHRKTHGKIGFVEMARKIGNTWKSLPPEEKKPFQDEAAKLKEQYNAELDVWKQEQKRKKAQARKEQKKAKKEAADAQAKASKEEAKPSAEEQLGRSQRSSIGSLARASAGRSSTIEAAEASSNALLRQFEQGVRGAGGGIGNSHISTSSSASNHFTAAATTSEQVQLQMLELQRQQIELQQKQARLVEIQKQFNRNQQQQVLQQQQHYAGIPNNNPNSHLQQQLRLQQQMHTHPSAMLGGASDEFRQQQQQQQPQGFGFGTSSMGMMSPHQYHQQGPATSQPFGGVGPFGMMAGSMSSDLDMMNQMNHHQMGSPQQSSSASAADMAATMMRLRRQYGM